MPYKKQVLSSSPLSRRELLRAASRLGLSGLAWSLTGCGGGGQQKQVGSSNRAATLVTATLDWGAADTRSAVITLQNALTGGTDLVWKINRTANSTGVYKSTLPVLAGPAVVYIAFHDGVDGNGTLKYAVTVRADIGANGNGLPKIATGTTASAYEAPLSQTIGINKEIPSPVTARSGDGVVALPPGTIIYTVTTGPDVLQVQPTGTIKALKPGSATLSAKVGPAEVAQTTYAADAAWASSELSFDTQTYAPDSRFYDIGEKISVAATYVTSSKDTPAWVWEGRHITDLNNKVIDDRSSFKIEPDSTAPPLHPKATLTLLRPSAHLAATYTLGLKDNPRSIQSSVRIRVPSQGVYGVENVQVIADKAGTGLTSVEVKSYDGLNGVGVMSYTEDGVAKTIAIVWSVGFNGGFLKGVGTPNLAWGDVFFGQYSESASDPVVKFTGKYENPDTGDFSRVVGTVTIGKYVATLALVKNGTAAGSAISDPSKYIVGSLDIGSGALPVYIYDCSYYLDHGESYLDAIFTDGKHTAVRLQIQHITGVATSGMLPVGKDSAATISLYDPTAQSYTDGTQYFDGVGTVKLLKTTNSDGSPSTGGGRYIQLSVDLMLNGFDPTPPIHAVGTFTLYLDTVK